MLRPRAHKPHIMKILEDELKVPSLYDEALLLLARQGIDVPKEVLERDFSSPYIENEGVVEAWRQVYTNSEEHWRCYELAEKLVDLEDYFRRWRFNHVTTVERIIGNKKGTGGTSGVDYLKRMLDVVLFPELWQVRTKL